MNKYSTLLLAIFLIFGCSANHTEPLPVAEEDLVKIMFDVHVAEGALAQLQGGAKKDSLADLYYDQVAEIQHIDRATLDSCLVILQRNPDLAKVVYEKVLAMMDKERLTR